MNSTLAYTSFIGAIENTKGQVIWGNKSAIYISLAQIKQKNTVEKYRSVHA